MTIVAGLNYALFSILLTDSRLSAQTPELVTRDMCQKIFPLGEAGLMAWSGDLLTARRVITRLVERHRNEGPWWLLNDGEVRKTLVDDSDQRQGGSGQPVSFVVQLINPWERSFEDEEWPRIEMVVVDFNPFRHEIVRMGARVRGSGSYVVGPFDEGNLFGKLFGFSSAWPDYERAIINKSMMAQVAIEELVGARDEATIGGLYQIAYILHDRVRVLAYERWIASQKDADYGTFVRLVVENGDWFQEHPPTQARVRLSNPFIEPVERDFAQDLVFDVASLPLDAPGVERREQPQRMFRLLSVHGVAGAPQVFDPQLYVGGKDDGQGAV